MPADHDLTIPTRGSTLRDLARQLGVTGFWRWWAAELAAVVPAAPRAALQRRRMRTVLAFDTTVATLWQPQTSGGQVKMVEQATIPLEGDAAAVVAGGRAALASVRAPDAPLTSPIATASPKVVIALPPRSVLRKTLTLPAAVEENLRQTIGYDIDRHTPFKPDELYFDAAVMGRDASRATINVDLVAARRSTVDNALKHADAWGATVVGVSPEPPGAANASRLNLLPAELRPMRTPWKRWQFWLPIAILLAVALLAVVLPVWQKREYAIAINTLADQARMQAAVSETLRNELDRQAGDYNFALERKYTYPSSVQIIEDVTRILPDDTWLTQLEVKTTRGKETQRELSLRGESANAGRLVTLLEDSKMFAQAAPRSPTTKIQPGPGEIFDVGAQLRPLATPAPVAVVVADNTATVPAPSTSPAGANAVQASPAAVPPGTTNTPATKSAPATPGAPAASTPPPAPATAPTIAAPTPPATVPPASTTTPPAAASAPGTSTAPAPATAPATRTSPAVPPAPPATGAPAAPAAPPASGSAATPKRAAENVAPMDAGGSEAAGAGTTRAVQSLKDALAPKQENGKGNDTTRGRT